MPCHYIANQVKDFFELISLDMLTMRGFLHKKTIASALRVYKLGFLRAKNPCNFFPFFTTAYSVRRT